MTAPVFPSVNAGLLAKLLNISERRVQQLAKQGIIARSRLGEYDLCRSLHGYTAYLQSLITAPDSSHESAALQRQRVRLVKAQADRAEHLYRVESGEWVALDVVEQAFQGLAATFIGSLETLPGRLAFELVGISEASEIKMRLLTACRVCREQTGERLRELGETFRKRAEISPAVSIASFADSRSVGGCAPEPPLGECGAGALAEFTDAVHDSDCASLHATRDQAGDRGHGKPDG